MCTAVQMCTVVLMHTTQPTQAALLASDIDAATRVATDFANYADLTAAMRARTYSPLLWQSATGEREVARRHLVNRLSSDGIAPLG